MLGLGETKQNPPQASSPGGIIPPGPLHMLYILPRRSTLHVSFVTSVSPPHLMPTSKPSLYEPFPRSLPQSTVKIRCPSYYRGYLFTYVSPLLNSALGRSGPSLAPSCYSIMEPGTEAPNKCLLDKGSIDYQLQAFLRRSKSTVSTTLTHCVALDMTSLSAPPQEPQFPPTTCRVPASSAPLLQ